VIIGCGEYKPLKSYISDLRITPSTPFPYPIYAHPSLTLHKSLGFGSNLGYSKPGEEKAYEANLGGVIKRTITAIKVGPMAHIGDVMTVGPKAQNGGEMILEAGELFLRCGLGLADKLDGTCPFLHRMIHTADHTELDVLAKEIGATHVPGVKAADAMQCKA
jgi:hypothetical protein